MTPSATLARAYLNLALSKNSPQEDFMFATVRKAILLGLVCLLASSVSIARNNRSAVFLTGCDWRSCRVLDPCRTFDIAEIPVNPYDQLRRVLEVAERLLLRDPGHCFNNAAPLSWIHSIKQCVRKSRPAPGHGERERC